MKPRIPPPVLALLAGVLMGWLHHVHPVASLLTGELRWLGLFLAVGGVAIAVSAVLRFRRASTTSNPLRPDSASALVTGGVFAFSRNPMYLGMLAVLAGWALWLGSLSPWLVLPLFTTALTLLQIVPEERALQQLFGEDYAQYRRHTDRWLGRFSGRL